MKVALLAAVLAIGAAAAPKKKECPPLKRGSFVIDRYQLYPENADWDADRCLVLFGILWNAAVGIYDPYKDNFVSILTFPNITDTASLHIGGVAWDPYTGLYTILVDSAPPWATGGADVSGDNLLMKYDPDRKKVLWTLNITAVTQGKYGGFQDVETDARGNTFVVGTFPGTIMKADKHGKAIEPWYLPPVINTTDDGFGGLVALGDILLSNDGDGQIYRFDMRDKKGKKTLVPMKPEVLYEDNDGIYAPPKYGGKVLLLASHSAGIQVLWSKDAKWKTAEYLGTIPRITDPLADGSATVAATQMGSNAVYSILDWFADPWVPGQVAGNRSLFPMPDITAQIEKLLK